MRQPWGFYGCLTAKYLWTNRAAFVTNSTRPSAKSDATQRHVPEAARREFDRDTDNLNRPLTFINKRHSLIPRAMNILPVDVTLTETDITQRMIPLPEEFSRHANGIGTLLYASDLNAQLLFEWTAQGLFSERLFAPDYTRALKVGAKIRVAVVDERPGVRCLQLMLVGNPGVAPRKPKSGTRRPPQPSRPAVGPGDNEIPGEAVECLDQVLDHLITSIEGDNQGWGSKLESYRYAGMNEDVSSLQHLLHFSNLTARPFKELCQAENIDWEDADTRRKLELEAESICIWGGVSQGRGYKDAWKVAKSAIQGIAEPDAPMNSGWTKVAAFASDGRENEQTIWDSRVAVSVINRINSALDALDMSRDAQLLKWLGEIRIVPSQSNERNELIQQLKQRRWKVGSCDWRSHFRGSAIVRRMTTRLRGLQIPFPEGLPEEFGTQWNVFTVGMALFMDGK